MFWYQNIYDFVFDKGGGRGCPACPYQVCPIIFSFELKSSQPLSFPPSSSQISRREQQTTGVTLRQALSNLKRRADVAKPFLLVTTNFMWVLKSGDHGGDVFEVWSISFGHIGHFCLIQGLSCSLGRLPWSSTGYKSSKRLVFRYTASVFHFSTKLCVGVNAHMAAVVMAILRVIGGFLAIFLIKKLPRYQI